MYEICTRTTTTTTNVKRKIYKIAFPKLNDVCVQSVLVLAFFYSYLSIFTRQKRKKNIAIAIG